jgi:hypothetical protein
MQRVSAVVLMMQPPLVVFIILPRSYSIPDWASADPLAAAGVGEVVAAAGDDGRVRLFNYPCVVEGAPGG